jgi:hypothetical protein
MDERAKATRWAPLPAILGRLALLALAVVGLSAFADLAFSERKGPFRSITDVADLDGDGDLDVLVGHTRWEAPSNSFAGITLWTNDGDGRFSRQKLHGGYAAAAGDVDRDGDADVLFLGLDGLSLSRNRGGAQGGTPGDFGPGSVLRRLHGWSGHTDMGGSVTVGDLNGDGAVDALLTSCCYGWTGDQAADHNGLVPSFSSIWTNAAEPGGATTGRAAGLARLDGLPVRAAALGDVDGDGDLDAFAAIGAPRAGSSDSRADLVLLNDGVGNFTDSGQNLGASDSRAVALADLDGDGDLDALVGGGDGATVWLNQGGAQAGQTGSFLPSAQTFPRDDVKSVHLADLDGDGDRDALIGGARRATIWWNDGRGAFAESEQRFRITARQGLAIGDFDGDGALDIFAGAGSDDVRVWRNQGNGRFGG